MKVLTLKIGENTYMTGKLSAFFTKEALRIQKTALDTAQRAKSVTELDLDIAAEIVDETEELLDRKVWLICEVFGNKFTPDDVLKELSNEEIDNTINMIIRGASKVIEKN